MMVASRIHSSGSLEDHKMAASVHSVPETCTFGEEHKRTEIFGFSPDVLLGRSCAQPQMATI